jgi:sigma-B regulation protein RsbU (phosphoserine phosphatase)
LEQARHIQLAWLPDLKSVPAGIEVSAANLPASHVSGDFYNWFALPSMMMRTGVNAGSGDHGDVPSGKVAVVIGDVTGHGMSAAFLMATTQLLVRMTMTRYMDAGRCLREVNRQLCMQAGGFKGQFVTMLVMILDTQHNTLQVASAGHPAPLIEAAGKFETLDLEPQFLLGVNQDEDYTAKSFPLEPGASVVLYTDGVVEAENGAGDQYKVENLLRVLQGQENGEVVEPGARIRAVLNDVKRFCGHRELMDDVTLVALRTTAVPAAVS